MKKDSLALMIFASVLLGILLMSSNGHASTIVCKVDSIGWTHCIDTSTGRSWTIKPDSMGTTTIKHVSVGSFSPNFNERDLELRNVICGFDNDKKFFCVNARTGQVWRPVPKRVI